MNLELRASLFILGLVFLVTSMPDGRKRHREADEEFLKLPEYWAESYGKPRVWASDYLLWYRWFFPALASVAFAYSAYPYGHPWVLVLPAFLFVAAYKEWPGPKWDTSGETRPSFFRRHFPKKKNRRFRVELLIALVAHVIARRSGRHIDWDEDTLLSIVYVFSIIVRSVAVYFLLVRIIAAGFMAIADRQKRPT